jgi:GntR family transcriptional regulator, histidine utilization repressor
MDTIADMWLGIRHHHGRAIVMRSNWYMTGAVDPLKTEEKIFTGPQPLYRQFKDYVLARIRSGEWSAGTKMPSESMLVRELGISRMTVNRGLRELMHEGFVSRIHGVGTFVRELPHQASLIELRNIADEMRDMGYTHSAQIIEAGEIPAPPELAERFELPPGDTLFHIVLVHGQDGVPVQIEDRYVNPEIAPAFLDQDFTKATPTEYLMSIAPLGELEHVVKASMPTPDEQNLLDILPTEPCLVLHRRSWSWGKVVSIVTFTYPAGRYELRGRYRTTSMGTLVEGHAQRPVLGEMPER